VTGSKLAQQNTNLLASFDRANLVPVTDFHPRLKAQDGNV
jgi:hypothetical protein